jgi:hypothetical protein
MTLDGALSSRNASIYNRGPSMRGPSYRQSINTFTACGLGIWIPSPAPTMPRGIDAHLCVSCKCYEEEFRITPDISRRKVFFAIRFCLVQSKISTHRYVNSAESRNRLPKTWPDSRSQTNKEKRSFCYSACKSVTLLHCVHSTSHLINCLQTGIQYHHTPFC